MRFNLIDVAVDLLLLKARAKSKALVVCSRATKLHEQKVEAI